jgi:hypothetical protein
MRTMVPFVLSPLVFNVFLYAQPPSANPADQIERLLAGQLVNLRAWCLPAPPWVNDAG